MVGLSVCKLVKSVGIHRDGLLEMSVSDAANFNSSGGVSLPGDIWFSVEEWLKAESLPQDKLWDEKKSLIKR